MDLHIEMNNYSDVSQDVEMIEKKGKGQPDMLCNILAENLSGRIANLYEKEYGHVPFFNFDKALLIPGETIPEFGGGCIFKPMNFIIYGNAPYELNLKETTHDAFIKDILYEGLKSNYRFLHEKNFLIQNEVKLG